MKKKLMQKLFLLVLLASVSILSVRTGYSLILGSAPFHVVLIGTVISLDEKGGPRTFDLVHKENKWRFRVTEAYNSGSPSGVRGWRLLDEIFPRRINLVGNVKALQILMQPDVVGKEYTFKGRLYLGSKKLLLSSVKEVVKEDAPSEAE